ncbi:HK97 family phage prohead protease [Cellulomonas timonensis]|uniref:HK97 family phage prohead protease n=1 Tax=Cellulomonas timonensis TaxID=1689271 RepID=UPI0008372496|nr:HK97 family phage prohead protease [Cellulomonas timonensis]
MTDIEAVRRRGFEQPVRLRAAPEGSGSPGVLAGYALRFNQLSRDLGGWFEEIDPAAVDLATTGRVLCRWNHDSSGLLGTTDAGTLRLLVDGEGLAYENDLPGTSLGRDVAVLAERGDVAYSSFAFRVMPGGERWYIDAEDRLVCRVLAMSLIDVAPVADPAYWASSAGMTRSIDVGQIRSTLTAPAPTDTSAADRLRTELAWAHALGDRITTH